MKYVGPITVSMLTLGMPIVEDEKYVQNHTHEETSTERTDDTRLSVTQATTASLTGQAVSIGQGILTPHITPAG